jgi:hypothetical protein
VIEVGVPVGKAVGSKTTKVGEVVGAELVGLSVVGVHANEVVVVVVFVVGVAIFVVVVVVLVVVAIALCKRLSLANGGNS